MVCPSQARTLPLSAAVRPSITVSRWRAETSGVKSCPSAKPRWKGRLRPVSTVPGCRPTQIAVGVATADFDREIAQDHVERRLGGPIGVPAAGAVVADAADAGGERGEDGLPPRRHQRQQVFRHHRRPDRIEAEALHQRGGIERAIALLGLRKARPLQGAGRDDHQPRGCGDPGRRRGDAGLVGDVDLSVAGESCARGRTRL